MKRFVFAVLLAVLLSNKALAAGPFDGIYQIPNTREFYSVHQSGNGIIIGLFTVTPAPTGLTLTLSNGQRFRVANVNTWDLLSGSITSVTAASPNATANVQGELGGGACIASISIVFSATGGVGRATGFTQTAEGAAQSINCNQLFQDFAARFGGFAVFNLTRIF